MVGFGHVGNCKCINTRENWDQQVHTQTQIEGAQMLESKVAQ